MLVAHRYAIAGGKIPAVLTKDTDDAFQERMTLVERLCHSLDGLYAVFLQDRLGELWKEAWEPAVVCWAEDQPIPAEVLQALMGSKPARSKKAKSR